jgi:hypothetical protein
MQVTDIIGVGWRLDRRDQQRQGEEGGGESAGRDHEPSASSGERCLSTINRREFEPPGMTASGSNCD